MEKVLSTYPSDVYKGRCQWVTEDDIYIKYHDEGWGVPIYNDNKLLELLILEGAQAGLSWLTVLKKRECYRELYECFNPLLVANFCKKKKEELLADSRIIRNKLKIEASILNAQVFLEVQKEFGSFSNYIWKFTNNKIIQNKYTQHDELPSKTLLSDTISKELKGRGFKFVGSTIIYAFMQAIGMVNDHLTSCFRHDEVKDLS
ncbi:DNA-3-methyladenine glycosylase I [Candidatus Bandiella numerosa]|uniref:DNA-3-methyladenine glycosylase I n=1 Tax=Candidatus Bandiella numerosa TaxID=2570586 RepID=UPI001F3D0992